MQKVAAHAADLAAPAIGKLLSLTETQIGPRLDLEHERKILRTHAGLEVAHHIFHTHQLLGDAGGQRVLGRGIDGGWVNAFIVHRRRRAKAPGY